MMGCQHRDGSSPLSRGILGQEGIVGLDDRIIPALAGNTGAGSSTTGRGRDHPRSRGEYELAIPRDRNGTGSSPLSRGIQPAPRPPNARTGIIPALAGNTWTTSSPESRTGDHPRSRGEYLPSRSCGAFPRGSSPLSRGILCPCRTGRLVVRIIPALAGNTAAA